MNRDDIKTLAGNLALDLETDDTLDVFLEDVFYELGENPTTPFVHATIKTLTSGTATYSFEEDALKIIHLIMFDELITESTENELNAYAETWRDDSGIPATFTQDKRTARTYTLYPNPDFSSDAFVPVYYQIFGRDYPDNTLTLIYTDNRESDILEIFSLPIALNTLEKEFLFPSDHTDLEFSTACGELKRLFYLLVGII